MQARERQCIGGIRIRRAVVLCEGVCVRVCAREIEREGRGARGDEGGRDRQREKERKRKRKRKRERERKIVGFVDTEKR